MTNSPEAGRRDDESDTQVLRALSDGEEVSIWRIPGVGWRPRIDPVPRGLLSGSFNPRHAGHDALREAAEQWIGGPVHFELPLVNADKPALDVATAVRRCRQFDDRPLLVSRAGTFIEKARILPGVTFVVGADTAERVVAQRFYGPRGDLRTSRAAMLECLEELRELHCRFLVATRALPGRVVRLPDVPVPAGFDDLFAGIPEERFRLDLTSSQLRGGQS